MHKYMIVVLVVAALCAQSEAKVFTRCGLVQELRRQGFPANQLRDWVCLIEAESGRNTAVIGPVNSNGSRDWGLFQINDRYWCSTGSSPGKDCNVRCRDLITDNITRASNCAKIIFRRHNFNAWYGWINKCRGKPLPDISKC
ncbi:lysozyme-like [Anticarsia gemmatalis]|uniref:lysozyme-like n=1 Tax=Anticarsia gemmatalis TaxID=129554 RepID=UPI003F777D50